MGAAKKTAAKKTATEKTVAAKKPAAAREAPAGAPTDLPIELFATTDDWSSWLAKRHASSKGVWMRLAKKDSALASISYAQALDEALCYGWIDGQKRSFDADSWLQRFTPRGARSLWSQINRGHIARLTGEGRMKATGIAEVERAKKDGRWDAAYASQKNTVAPDDLKAALEKTPRAKELFATLNSANRYAIVWRVLTAKLPETRARRIEQLVAMLARGEKLHP